MKTPLVHNKELCYQLNGKLNNLLGMLSFVDLHMDVFVCLCMYMCTYVHHVHAEARGQL